jgi:hypothetical protein
MGDMQDPAVGDDIAVTSVASLWNIVVPVVPNQARPARTV